MSKPKSTEIIQMLKDDLKVRQREYRLRWKDGDIEAVKDYHVNDYIEWLIEHLEYWVEEGHQP